MNIPAKKWTKKNPPKRILAIRLQAMGDLVITLPYLQALRNMLPRSTQLDLLTRKEVDPIPHNIYLFNKIYSIGGGRNFKKQFIHTWWLLPLILIRRYDVVLDLQNNLLSKIVRKGVAPHAWSEFDKVSPVAAGERTRLTIEAAGLGNISAFTKFKLKKQQGVEERLKKNGWDGVSDLVILNPAGAFSTRNWPIENYVDFAKLYLKKFPSTQFLVIGVDLIAQKANYLKEKLDESLINLVNKTTAAEAFAITQKATFALSEDSGLMHMAWVSGIPTLALFGSTRSDWSRPLGEHTLLFGSSDLPCGNCMRVTCIYDEVRCLIQYSVEFVFEQAVALIEKVSHDR
jgi:heptosyltransferase-2